MLVPGENKEIKQMESEEKLWPKHYIQTHIINKHINEREVDIC